MASRLPCADWLKLMQISRQSVVETSEECVARLSALKGVSADRVRACGVRAHGNRVFRYLDETFGINFALRTHTSYCPACLLEDTDPDSPSNGQRVGRVMWSFAPLRTCPRHGIALVRRRNAGVYEQFQDVNLVAPGNAELEQQASQAEQCHLSPLQTYVERRFAADRRSDWLDRQGIDQAARACEMIGVCRVSGAHTNLGKLSQRQWDEVGAAGYDAARAGPDGIRLALEGIAVQSRMTGSTG